jgi:hypothetical protein
MNGKAALAKLNILGDLEHYIDKKAQEKIAAGARVGAAAVLSEMPVVDALVDGKEVFLTIGAFQLLGGIINFPGIRIPFKFVVGTDS